LCWKHIDFENSTVKIEQAWKFKTGELGLPKWNKIRATPLPAKTVKALKALRAESFPVLPDALVFCYPDGTRLGDRWWGDTDLNGQAAIVDEILDPVEPQR